MKKISELKILIVDDMLQWINHHKELLQHFYSIPNNNISIEFSAEAGIKNVLANDIGYYDLIITDMQMEEISDEKFAGEWLLEKLKNNEKCLSTRFLILSSAFNIKNIAERFNVSYIDKSILINNPLLLKYKLDELFLN